MTYRISPAAAANLDEIIGYISERSPQGAANLLAKMIRQWELIATQPEAGSPRHDILPDIRSLVVGSYVAFYRVEDSDVLIIRVLHGHREITPDHFG